jgi:transposase-like protein
MSRETQVVHYALMEQQRMRNDKRTVMRARAERLFADPDNTTGEIAQRLGVHRATVLLWRKEWEARQ